MKLSLEQLIIKRDKLKEEINKPDALSQAFYGGMVGFKKGSAKKKFERSLDKSLDRLKELDFLNEKIKRLQNPIKRSKAIEQNPNEWNVGEKATDSFNNLVTIIKINTKTVSIQYEGGFKETCKPHLLNKIK